MGLKNTKDNTYLNVELLKVNLSDLSKSSFVARIYKDKATRDAQLEGRFTLQPERIRLAINDIIDLTVDFNKTTANDIINEVYECLAITEEYSVDNGWIRQD